MNETWNITTTDISLMINETKTTNLNLEDGEVDIGLLSHFDPKWLVLLRVIILIIIIVFASTGNSLVLICVCRIKEMKTVTGVFLANLAASDLGVSLFCIPVAIVASFKENILEDTYLCGFNGFTLVLFFIGSIQTMSVISIHKYIAVVHAMRTTVTKKRACVALVLIWFVSMILAIGPAVGWDKYTHIKGRHQCSTASPTSPAAYSYLVMLLMFGYVLPLLTMLFCYARLYCTTRKHIKRLKASAITNCNEAEAENQLINTLLIILLTFIICWLPFVVYIVYGILNIHIPFYMPTIAFLFGYGNSALNPIIYALRHRSFRRGFWEILTVCFNENIRNRFATSSGLLGKDHRNMKVSWASPKLLRTKLECKRNCSGGNGRELRTFLDTPEGNRKHDGNVCEIALILDEEKCLNS
eukprot:gene19988-21950_t